MAINLLGGIGLPWAIIEVKRNLGPSVNPTRSWSNRRDR